MTDKEELELEVRRILASEVEGHRTFLQSQFRNLTWGVGILFTVGAIIFTFLLGKSIAESKATLVSTIDTKVVDYRIVESFKNRLEEFINIAVEKAVIDDKTKLKIATEIDSTTKEAVAKVEADVEDKLIKTVTNQVSKTTNLNTLQLLEKVSMPSGAVMPFDRATCPQGWSEYVAAHGRFIRGLDKSGKIDPSRKLGSKQEDSFKSHDHKISETSGGLGGSAPGLVMTNSHHAPKMTGFEGGSETRPKNIALLYCKKK